MVRRCFVSKAKLGVINKKEGRKYATALSSSGIAPFLSILSLSPESVKKRYLFRRWSCA